MGWILGWILASNSCLTQLKVILGWVELWLSWGFDNIDGPGFDGCDPFCNILNQFQPFSYSLPILNNLNYFHPSSSLKIGNLIPDILLLSGGPLMIKNKKKSSYTVIGLASWTGEDCASKRNPGVFVRVTYFLDWIKQNTRGSNICEAWIFVTP